MSKPRRSTATVYWFTFAALLALTAATVTVAAIPLGRWHTPLALAIAAFKATLVIVFFMHASRGPQTTWVVIGAAISWLGILVVLVFADYLSRA